MRLFVALPLPGEARDALSDLQTGLRVGRQVGADQFHVTLAFFAEVAPQQLADLDAALEEIRAWPFDVAFSGVDIFGGSKPRLVAAMVRPSPELETLHRAVQGAARLAGLGHALAEIDRRTGRTGRGIRRGRCRCRGGRRLFGNRLSLGRSVGLGRRGFRGGLGRSGVQLGGFGASGFGCGLGGSSLALGGLGQLARGADVSGLSLCS